MFLNPWVNNIATRRESFSFVACVSIWHCSKRICSPRPVSRRPAERSDRCEGLSSRGEWLELAFEWARREWIACVHQDVFLPRGRMSSCRTTKEAERRFGPIGVAGVYGVGAAITTDEPGQPVRAERIGWVNDRGRVLRDGPELPARGDARRDRAGHSSKFGPAVRSGAWLLSLWSRHLPPARTRAGRGGIGRTVPSQFV